MGIYEKLLAVWLKMGFHFIANVLYVDDSATTTGFQGSIRGGRVKGRSWNTPGPAHRNTDAVEGPMYDKL